MTDPQRTARQLADEAGGIREELTRIRLNDRRRRWQVIVLTVSVALDLLLSAAFFYGLHRVSEASSATRAACLASNVSAAKQHTLWAGLLSLPQPKGQPPADPATLAAFNQLLDDTFVQQDCH